MGFRAGLVSKDRLDYYGFGPRTLTLFDAATSMSSGPIGVKQNIEAIKFGINYQFWTGGTSSPDRPASCGRLRFILRSALPRLSQRDLSSSDELLGLPESQRLVILSGGSRRLSYAVQSRLGLEAIHPVLNAFATAHDPSRLIRR